MSRKFVNILTSINIILGTIFIFTFFREHQLNTINMISDENLYMNLVYDVIILCIFGFISFILEYLRKETNRGIKFMLNKKTYINIFITFTFYYNHNCNILFFINIY